MADMRRLMLFIAVALTCSACAALGVRVPDGAYYPKPSEPQTIALARVLYRAAEAAGDDPARYSFALVGSDEITALSAEEAVFYFSEGLTRQPPSYVDALVAHEVLGHAGQRRVLSYSVSAGFAVLGFVVPGLGFADFVVNPLVVRAFTRDQEIEADLKAVEILRAMGSETPRRTLTEALQAAATINGPPKGGLIAKEPGLEVRLLKLEPLEPPRALALTAPALDEF